MRIAINARFLIQRLTGVQRYAREITRGIARLLGPENIKLIAPAGAAPEFVGLEVFHYGGFVRGHAWEQVVLPMAVRRNRTDLLFSPGNTGPILVSDQVVTVHDVGVFARPEGFNPNFVRWYQFLLPRLTQQVRRVVTISEFSKREIVKYLGISPDKITVIPNGVSERFTPMEQRAILAFKEARRLPERFILGLASRAPNKNFGGLLKAWQYLCERTELKDLWLVVAGGVSRTLQIDPANAGMQNLPWVYDLGYVSDEDLPALYNAADVFVFPSFYEGFGLPPLEAMACGTPVVVSSTASLPEVVGDAGVYVNPYDVEDIAQGIYRVLTDQELRRQLREKGLARAKLFTWERSAKETLRVFEEVFVRKEE
ncbi:glycosyltransferase family 4 protein [Moorella sp. E306M]|uniref:glycosyltransferase family 4 protein n=1 Tax=Moorella sp. E306M TaxID=2572683 RepID=UPI0010FFB47E|nr:glycosyltransferase family 1 protein [Moorella sp. E306M]GEA17233.1 mannosyltransferase [Moorella sp. E306M]